MVISYLIKGKTVLIDDQDKDVFEAHNWHLVRARQLTEKYYVFTSINGKSVYLHRLLMAAKTGEVVDHINRNPLDCSRENLRITTSRINRLNSAVQLNKTTSAFKCVYKTKRNVKKPYYSMLNLKGNHMYLGSFATEQEAANAYNAKIKELFPELVA